MIFHQEIATELDGNLVGAEAVLAAPWPGPDRCLWLAKPLLDAWGLPLGGSVEVSYGQRAAEALIGVAGDPPAGAARGTFVVPSESLARELCLVTGLEYRIARTGPRSIALGPVVGLIVEGTRPRGTAQNPDWDRLVQAYDEVKGLTILFGPDDVDWAAGVVNGRYYDPRSSAGPWVPGRFPIPSAAHRRAVMPAEQEAQWLQGAGPRLFNGRWSTDRWELYQAMARHEDLTPHLARVWPASSFRAVAGALEQSGEVWLKPRSPAPEAQGGAIVRLRRADGGFEVLSYAEDRDARRRFRAERDLRAFLTRRGLLGNRFIVQEAVPGATIAGRGFDVRLLIQRDGAGELCCPAKLARLGAPGSAGAAPLREPILLPVDLVLTAALRVSLETAREAEARAVAWACEFVARLEEDFHALGDVSVDVIVGPGGEVWLIDCDLCPDYSLFAGFDAGMHRAACTMWHRYASFLASFPLPGGR